MKIAVLGTQIIQKVKDNEFLDWKGLYDGSGIPILQESSWGMQKMYRKCDGSSEIELWLLDRINRDIFSGVIEMQIIDDY